MELTNMIGDVDWEGKAPDFELGGIHYSITSPRELTVVRGNEYSGTLDIPASVSHDGVAYAVTSIGFRAFYCCSALTDISIPDSVTSIGDYAFWHCCGLTSVSFPSSVTRIGNGSFMGCAGLTSVEIADSVESIGFYAFHDCAALTSFSIPSSVTRIGARFCDCSTKLHLSKENSHFALVSDILYSAERDILVHCNSQHSNIVVDKNVRTIAEGAFFSCSSIASVTLPEGMTGIGNRAFYGCAGLTSVAIPSSVTSIGDYAFFGCSSLTELSSFAIAPPECGTDVFDGIDKNRCVLHVPTGTKSLYQDADKWRDFGNLVEDA